MNLNNKSGTLEMKVEIPFGSSNKYEFDEFSKKWKLDRVLHGTNFYPAEYGYIEGTLDFDGDPLDILCITSFSTFPGCTISVKLIGILKMTDQGEEDHKLIAVPTQKTDPRFSHVNSIRDIGHKKNELVDFFSNYKNLEGKKVSVEGFGEVDEALKVLENCKNMFHAFQSNLLSGFSREEAIRKTIFSFLK